MKKKVYALGFFDGVHLGHQALLNTCKEMAAQLGGIPCALTFDTYPRSLVTGEQTRLLNSVADRIMLLKQYGMEQVETLHFDKATMDMPWQDFFRFLTDELGAVGLVCGDDFRFGRKGEGNGEKLQLACRQAGIACAVVPEQSVDGVRVSSTHIRRCIEQGDLEQANRFLGHPHILSGQVVSGRKLGRTIGVPTANIALPEQVLAPRFGVYAAKVLLDGAVMTAVTNIGMRPTVNGKDITVESWILDFQGDIYGKTITLHLHKFLRPEMPFASLETLGEQIQADARQTKDYFPDK